MGGRRKEREWRMMMMEGKDDDGGEGWKRKKLYKAYPETSRQKGR